jgi:hypothetical protein
MLVYRRGSSAGEMNRVVYSARGRTEVAFNIDFANNRDGYIEGYGSSGENNQFVNKEQLRERCAGGRPIVRKRA